MATMDKRPKAALVFFNSIDHTFLTYESFPRPPAHPPQQYQRGKGNRQVQRQVAVIAGIDPVAHGEGNLLADDLRAFGMGVRNSL